MITVAALYQFAPFEDPGAFQKPLAQVACANGVRGTLLLAREGINGTVAGSADGISAVLSHIRTLPGCDAIEVKYSQADAMPFGRMKVRLKREIVTMGRPDVDPAKAVGSYIEPGEWNAFIREDDVVTIDTRNDYEVQIGTFSGAIDPETRSFGDFPDWWEQNGARFEGKRIAMFCTGGIRCEKATSYLLSQGVANVFHLKGGILRYLQEVPPEESTWHGQCFVFDERVSVGHGMVPGGLSLCRGCRRPLEERDLKHPAYESGVSCHRCIDETTEEQKARFRERQRQMEATLSHSPGHFGHSR